MNKEKRIMAINMNDFGGRTEHLMRHRYLTIETEDITLIGNTGQEKWRKGDMEWLAGIYFE